MARLIDGDKMLKEVSLEAIFIPCGKEATELALRQWIEKQPTVEASQSGWIPVSEKMPTPRRNVLVTDGEDVWSDMYDDKAPYDFYFAGDNEVIAWRELPQPYQPKGE